MVITILCDNYSYNRALRTCPGFSCLVQTKGKNILFDTGAHSGTLLYNMQKLDFDPKEINDVVLSHIDADHVGGLFGMLEVNREAKVYILSSFPPAFRYKIQSHGVEIVEVSEPVEICDGVESIGELGTWVKEQSLIVRTEKGIVIIVACGHPGVVNIIERAKELEYVNRIRLVLGGFHLGGTPNHEVSSVVKNFRALGVEEIAPCHSTGGNARKLFQEEYGGDFMEIGVGSVVRLL